MNNGLVSPERPNSPFAQGSLARQSLGFFSLLLVLNIAVALVLSLPLIGATDEQVRASLGVVYLLQGIEVLLLAIVFKRVQARVLRPLRELIQHQGRMPGVQGEPGAPEIKKLGDMFSKSLGQVGELIRHLEEERAKFSQAEPMFRGLSENSVVGVYVAQDGRFRFVNNKMAEMFGYDRNAMVNCVRVADLAPESERSLVETNVQRRLQGEAKEVHYERRAIRKDGTLFYVEVYGSAMPLGDGTATIGVMVDVTRRKEAEAKMQAADIVYRNSSEAMAITDAHGLILDVNPAFSRITGYSHDEAVGRRVTILRSGRQDKEFYKAMWASLIESGQWQGEIWNRRKNGEIYAEWLTINTAYDKEGAVYRRVALFYDITKKKSAEDLIWRQANFDALTGLPNRLMFLDRVKHEIRKANRCGSLLALAFIDLDRFKDVNDSLGHSFGDLLLQQAARRLTACVRESDTVARLGGDEFVIILPDLQRTSDVDRIVGDVLNAMGAPFLLGDEPAHVSASIGVTFFPWDGREPEILLKNADQAMYAAKATGRNRYQLFTASMDEAVRSRRRIATDLRSAIARSELELHYQPIFCLRGLNLTKAEALLRWRHPQRGLVSPADFIPIAEDTGLIEEIGDWVFHEATRQARAWRKVCPNFQISINTSPIQYRNAGLPLQSWFEHLNLMELPGEAVTVEITESLVLETSEAITQQFSEMRNQGFRIALDDFGTGYSSLSQLSKLDIDYIKIDRSFISGLTEGKSNLALCEAMIKLAHTLGVHVVAEGIETDEQRDCLTAIGCDFGQGYLLSRPLLQDDFEKLLTDFEERRSVLH